MPSRAVVWFRRDLRLADHPALLAALAAADQVVPVFVADPALLEGRPSGPNRQAFLHGALQSLDSELAAAGGRLLLRQGDPVEIIPALAREAAASAVYCSREFTPYARRRDAAVARALRADGRALHACEGVYLSDFDQLRTAGDKPFRIYSPFARAAKAAAWDDPLPAPARVPVPDEPSTSGLWTAEPAAPGAGLWTAGDASTSGRLRSPTGGPSTGPGASGVPGSPPGSCPALRLTLRPRWSGCGGLWRTGLMGTAGGGTCWPSTGPPGSVPTFASGWSLLARWRRRSAGPAGTVGASTSG